MAINHKLETCKRRAVRIAAITGITQSVYETTHGYFCQDSCKPVLSIDRFILQVDPNGEISTNE